MDTGKTTLVFPDKAPDPSPVIIMEGLLPATPRMKRERRLFDFRKAGLQPHLEVRSNGLTLCQAHLGVKTQVCFDSHVSSVTRSPETPHLTHSLIFEKLITHAFDLLVLLRDRLNRARWFEVDQHFCSRHSLFD